MSGASERNDDDFLDDDFVIEDLAGKNDDLDQLFTAPPAKSARPAGTPAGDGVEPDADDVLFTDHTQGLRPSEEFAARAPFREDTPSQWSGDGLELEEVGVPQEPTTPTEPVDSRLVDAEERFTEELGSLLRSEEEFAVDSDSELELVDGATVGDGISEIEQSGPFVLDDGEGAWQEDAADANELETVGVGAGDGLEAPSSEAAEFEEEPLVAQRGDEEANAEPGWEPLPSANVDQLAEVGEVARVDEDSAPVAEAAPADLAEVEGHEIYAEEAAAPVLVGPRAGKRGGMLRMLVAAVLLLGASAAVVLRPEWLGLRIEPERLQQARIDRPKVELGDGTIAVAKPQPGQASGSRDPKVVLPSDRPSTPVDPVAVVPVPSANPGEPSAPTSTEPGTSPAPTNVPAATPNDQPLTGQPVAVQPPPVDAPMPPPAPPTVPDVTPEPAQPVVVHTDTPVPTGPEAGPVTVPGNGDPVAVSSPPGIPVVVPAPSDKPEGDAGWPVAKAGPGAPNPNPTQSPRLVRVGDDLMLGDQVTPAARGGVVDGVMPGSRAFAQLHNGNYFIGSVKCVGAESITLKVGEGEVTLRTFEVARLTELGSSDYEQLQKAASGFVRLTNNNRLVGGILSHIADDHIVLEFRSNRVMLPRSAIGEVVQGDGDAGVRLDTTREEESWVKRLAERQLGTGQGPTLIPETPKKKSAQAPAEQPAAGSTPPSTEAPQSPVPAAPAPSGRR